jgi:hypothetical protein
MIPTTPSDNIQDFLAFLQQMIGLVAVRDRAGALPWDIERFAALVKLPLPPLYHGYLSEFGANDGPLKMADDGNPRIGSLIKLYMEQELKKIPEIPPHCVAIATGGLTGGRALVYKAKPDEHGGFRYSPDEPRVVVNEDADIVYVCAQSFRNYLYRQAFVRGRFPEGLPFASLFQTDDNLYSEASQFVPNLGFQAYWFSDDYSVCMERDDGAAIHIMRYNDRVSIYLSARDTGTRDQLKATLIQNLRLRDSSPPDPRK